MSASVPGPGGGGVAPTGITSVVRLDLTVADLLRHPRDLDSVRTGLANGVVYTFPSGVKLDFLRAFRSHLFSVLSSSFAGYQARQPAAPNHVRCHWSSDLQVVPANFISWSFFPWNEDPFRLFHVLTDLFALRNRLVGNEDQKYVTSPVDGLTARVAAQFYPQGIGFMEGHQDPLSAHQLAIPTVSLSEFGRDFHSGGVWMQDVDGAKLHLDPQLRFGDVTLFHSRIPHGVDVIDSDDDYIPLSPLGRLMFITAVNAMSDRAGADASANTI